MTSLMEVTELPTEIASVNAGHTAPLLSDLNLTSVLSAALETIPSILSDTLPAAYLAQRLHFVRPTPALAHVRWLQDLEQQDGNALVLDRRGLTARGGLLPDDHLFKSMARKGLIRDNHVVWAARYTALAAAPSAAASASARADSAGSPTSSSANLGPLATSPSAPLLGTTAQQHQQQPAACATTTTTTTSTSSLLTPTVFNVYALSAAVCGHRGIVHGGLSSAIIDETFGYLLYLLYAATADGTIAAPAAAAAAAAGPPSASAEAASVAAAVRETTRGAGQSGSGGSAGGVSEDRGRRQSGVWEALAGVDLKAAMTAHLEVDFMRPLPSDSIVVCMAQVERVEGRKVWLQAQLMSRPPTPATITTAQAMATTTPANADAAVVYARGKALFVTPRPLQGGSSSSGSSSASLGGGRQ